MNGGNAASNMMHANNVDGIPQVHVDSGSRVFLPAADASFADEIKFFPGERTYLDAAHLPLDGQHGTATSTLPYLSPFAFNSPCTVVQLFPLIRGNHGRLPKVVFVLFLPCF